MAYTMTLPWPPSVNRYWRSNRGRVHLSGDGRAYQDAVRAVFDGETLTGPASVSIDACPPDRRKRDLDNILKCLLDGLEKAGVVENDNQFRRIQIQCGEVISGGVVYVTVEPMN